MRDIALTLIFLGLIPVMLKYPWIGVLAYAWVSIFNPHKWTFGFANDFPLAMLAGVVTVAGMFVKWKEARLPINTITVLLMLLPFWMTVTLMFALEPDDAYVRWTEVMKVFLFTLITASLLHSRKQLEALLWVLVLSIGFYGVKGGIFTLAVGGIGHDHSAHAIPCQHCRIEVDRVGSVRRHVTQRRRSAGKSIAGSVPGDRCDDRVHVAQEREKIPPCIGACHPGTACCWLYAGDMDITHGDDQDPRGPIGPGALEHLDHGIQPCK